MSFKSDAERDSIEWRDHRTDHLDRDPFNIERYDIFEERTAYLLGPELSYRPLGAWFGHPPSDDPARYSLLLPLLNYFEVQTADFPGPDPSHSRYFGADFEHHRDLNRMEWLATHKFISTSVIVPKCPSVAGMSESTYYTALSQPSARSKLAPLGQLQEEDDYAQLLQSQKLWPVDPMLEQNWSGRGQHAKFRKDQQKLINEILEVQENLGSTRTAIVQSVKCRRILLARKTITCGKQTMTKEEAIKEVSHLTRLTHAHIIRVIGTYVKGRELSILLYPVAEHNLEQFLEKSKDSNTDTRLRSNMRASCTKFYSCLSSAVRYIHKENTKHMDIKPKNILVKQVGSSLSPPDVSFKICIADFGIAKSYETSDEIETDGRTSFTKRYAAPEVVNQVFRGLPADIFSLGCVFVEIYAVISVHRSDLFSFTPRGMPPDEIGNKEKSYQANIEGLQDWLQYGFHVTLPFAPGHHKRLWDEAALTTLDMFAKMINANPHDRPTAQQISEYFLEEDCCTAGQVELQAMERDPDISDER
ncbi:kinase-like domain-containing protein [Phaeosphaeriaceae sp. PMI808]|nr:kinase-like domain-containing protein [Phaeosphaeriaceae sp. PMI808]